MTHPFVAMPGGWELVLIVLVILLLFGAKKLPEFARGTGQALRIFKAETKGLKDDDDQPAPPAPPADPAPRAELPPATGATDPGPERQSDPQADQHRN